MSLDNVLAQVGDREEGLRSPSQRASSRAGEACVGDNRDSTCRKMFEESLLEFLIVVLAYVHYNASSSAFRALCC